VDIPEILERFDEQMRRKPAAPDGFLVGDGWSALLWPPAAGDIDRAVARMREIPGWVEWKYYSHDDPELPERLVAAGLEPQAEETVVVAESASIAPPSPEVDLRQEPETFSELAKRVFGRDHGWLPGDVLAVVAYVDGQAVSGGRVDLDPGVEFAGLFGGVTLPEYRRRGLYAATVAWRAQIARDRGYRYLYVDALPTSRPILERLGFVQLTTTRPYVPRRTAR
jgi:GNAT superfamily N-acetyltransferase